MTNAPPLVHIHLQRQAKGDSSNLLFLCTNGGAQESSWKRFFLDSIATGFHTSRGHLSDNVIAKF